jgi:DNA-binding transcriptional LysR family regulator
MNLQRLKYFSAVVRTGGMRAAADALDLSQPALTRHIQALEHELGVDLFTRTRGRVRLTEAGRLLLSRIPSIEAEVDFLRHGLRALRKGGGGKLRIGALQTLVEYVLPQAILGWRRRYPVAGLTVFGFSTEQIVARVIAGEYDLGIVAAADPDRRLKMEPLFREPFAALVASGHRLAVLSEIDTPTLFDEDLVTFSADFRIRQMLEDGARRIGKPLRVAAEIETVSGIKSLALANFGVAALPVSALASEAVGTTCRVIPIRNAELSRTIYAVHRKDVEMPANARALLAEIRGVASKHLRGVSPSATPSRSGTE